MTGNNRVPYSKGQLKGCTSTAVTQQHPALRRKHLFCNNGNVPENIPVTLQHSHPNKKRTEFEEIPVSQSIKDVEGIVGLFLSATSCMCQEFTLPCSINRNRLSFPVKRPST